ncbi:MAG: hypothetical protein K0U68_10175 [Gammaproteobacteria bacterium]|nr:hypothetical protein [Gammaproteobacteria bacterium]
MKQQLLTFIEDQITQPASPALEAVKNSLLEIYPGAVQAILYYGSCLRSNNPFDGLVDLYVLVNQYPRAYSKHPLLTLSNRVLPPNVFYLETPTQQQIIRSKYAVFTVDDFAKACSKAWFNSYIWGRFCQPSRLLYAHDNNIVETLGSALSQAAITFTARVTPALDSRFNSEVFWSTGLSLSYRTELRPEQTGRALEIYHYDQNYYDSLTESLMNLTNAGTLILDDTTRAYQNQANPWQHKLCQLTWAIRRIQGKSLSLARLIKAAFTFQGGVDYIAWKIERHSGVKINVTDKLRRYPLIYGWAELWRLHRQGVLRS